MQEQEHHAMVIAETYPSGAEEWYCPICGYRFLMQWPPQYKKIIIHAGDPNAIHTGSGNSGQMDSSNEQAHLESLEENEKNYASLMEDVWLEPWLDFVAALNVGAALDAEYPGDAGQD